MCPIVEFDGVIAERWAMAFADLSREGQMIPANDLAIAATALHLDYGVLVWPRDEAHYRRINGFRCERLAL
ncbi:MAG: type II toxin-antitoxin system VapC family toxin [Gammaproteobacteria bacterium]